MRKKRRGKILGEECCLPSGQTNPVPSLTLNEPPLALRLVRWMGDVVAETTAVKMFWSTNTWTGDAAARLERLAQAAIMAVLVYILKVVMVVVEDREIRGCC